MKLPRVTPPDWFVSKLVILKETKVVIFDDDQTIHQIWNNRFSVFFENMKSVEHLSSSDQFKKYYRNNFQDLDEALFLMDFEIIGATETGLDLIEFFGIQNQAILVTSRYEECDIRERCEKLGVKLIPKSMSGFVPIELI